MDKIQEYGNTDINELIEQIKELCDELAIAYDKTKDRMFAKHILTAKQYGEFAQKINQTRTQLALNVLRASVDPRVKYWKGARSGPMKIYQDYEEVYNTAKKVYDQLQQKTFYKIPNDRIL